MMHPQLAGISLFPIKSLDPLSVALARVLSSGALEHDRRYMLVDAEGTVINAKRSPLLHRLRASFHPTIDSVRLAADSAAATEFSLSADRPRIEAWLSQFLELPVRMLEDPTAGFPDDPDSPGPTVVSTATLQAVSGWFDLALEEVRRRFRANLEIEHVEPFWEDRLFGEQGVGYRFQIGEAVLIGTNPCQRCAVPTRDSMTGDITSGFARKFAEHRLQLLAEGVARDRFDHGYRLSTNTRPAAAGLLRVGDAVRIL